MSLRRRRGPGTGAIEAADAHLLQPIPVLGSIAPRSRAIPAYASIDDPKVRGIAAAISHKVGDIDTFLRAQDLKDKDGKPLAFTESQMLELDRQLQKAILTSAKVFADKGWTADQITRFADKAWRADLGATMLQKTVSNSVSYSPMAIAGFATSLLLTPFLGPIPMIFTSAAVALFIGWKWSAHALKASGKVDSEVNSEKDGRGRFWKICPSRSFGQGLETELLADFAGRTGPRLLATAPLRILDLVLNVMGTASGLASFLGTYVIGPISMVVGPPSNGAMQVISKILHGRNGQRSAAPLFGIKLDIEKGKDGAPQAGTAKIGADTKKVDDNVSRNIDRLSKSGINRFFSMVGKLGPAYVKIFPKAVSDEWKVGMTPGKRIEAIFGLSTIGEFLGVGVELGATALSGSTAEILGTVGGIVTGAVGNAGNVVTRGEFERHAGLEKLGERKVSRSPVPAASGKATPATQGNRETAAPAHVGMTPAVPSGMAPAGMLPPGQMSAGGAPPRQVRAAVPDVAPRAVAGRVSELGPRAAIALAPLVASPCQMATGNSRSLAGGRETAPRVADPHLGVKLHVSGWGAKT